MPFHRREKVSKTLSKATCLASGSQGMNQDAHTLICQEHPLSPPLRHLSPVLPSGPGVPAPAAAAPRVLPRAAELGLRSAIDGLPFLQGLDPGGGRGQNSTPKLHSHRLRIPGEQRDRGISE